MYERISIDPKICHGQVCIKGTRVPVHQIVRMLANGVKNSLGSILRLNGAIFWLVLTMRLTEE